MQLLQKAINWSGLTSREDIKIFKKSLSNQLKFWLLAVSIGFIAGFAAVGFRQGVEVLQGLLYGSTEAGSFTNFVEKLAWYWKVFIPMCGGLIVGVILHKYTIDGRAKSVADVIQDAALNNGKINQGGGIASAFASLITLGSGGSSGREGPVVHLAAVISGWVCNKVQIDTVSNRDLLGCAVAAAVSASFNAPIAGALFALEVVLRHFAIHAFAPIVIASVIGTVINRLTFGNVTEFILPSANNLGFYIELPAFILLGLCCGLIAVILMKSLFWADDIGNSIQRLTGAKRWLRPAIAGTILGGLALWFPHIIGVGYETISSALTGEIMLHEAIIFAIMKVIAVSITIGGRMGGGVFSPSLMIGSLTGLAFGWIATSVFPTLSGEHTIYALAGMGAVSAAVLGAPISTTLIVFELTGDWQTGLAVMVAVSFSIVISSKLVHQSFFLTQIERRGIHLAAGPQEYILSTLRVVDLMKDINSLQKSNTRILNEMIDAGTSLYPDDTLEDAMPIFENLHTSFIPVIKVGSSKNLPSILGVLYQTDALKQYNLALVSRVKEEHS
tara:strand:- start:2954 stop:4627 length:1674 start_codon:yes stop_codon:yes gene_type:complete